MRTWQIALILLAGSVLITAVLFLLGLPFFFLFLFIPLIPLFGRSRAIRCCPVCGWETAGSECFCPYDGTPLRVPARKEGEGKD
jgi:hypothetical protein